MHEMQDIKDTILNDTNLQDLKRHVIEGWLSSRTGIKQDICQYWTLRDKLVIIDVVAMKGI